MLIDIPENTENINILLSGGADSTLLTYLLSKQTTKKIILHTTGSSDVVHKKIVEPIVTHLKTIFGDRYQINKIKKKDFWIRDAVNFILSVYPGVVLTGCNKVVTHFTPTVYLRGDTPPVRGSVSRPEHLRPFIDMDKVDILKIYQQENILNLLSLTKSCGLSKLPRCEGCYFCMERAWAANVLGINDINTIEPQTTMEINHENI